MSNLTCMCVCMRVRNLKLIPVRWTGGRVRVVSSYQPIFPIRSQQRKLWRWKHFVEDTFMMTQSLLRISPNPTINQPSSHVDLDQVVETTKCMCAKNRCRRHLPQKGNNFHEKNVMCGYKFNKVVQEGWGVKAPPYATPPPLHPNSVLSICGSCHPYLSCVVYYINSENL